MRLAKASDGWVTGKAYFVGWMGGCDGLFVDWVSTITCIHLVYACQHPPSALGPCSVVHLTRASVREPAHSGISP
eukprot:361451-Chlamydomonas_euryale.AAC.6